MTRNPLNSSLKKFDEQTEETNAFIRNYTKLKLDPEEDLDDLKYRAEKINSEVKSKKNKYI